MPAPGRFADFAPGCALTPCPRVRASPACLVPLDILQETSYARLVEYLGERRVPPTNADVLQGTLDLLILKALSVESMHGWGVAQRIQQISRDVLQVNQGSLYPALHRLEHRGWIAASWGASDNNRRAKFYRLTATGRKQLQSEVATWRRFSSAIELVLAIG